MQAERWQQVEELFGGALDRAPDERATFLTDACGNDDGLRREVEALLASHQRAGDFIQAPAFEDALNLIKRPEPALESGHRIGSYEVIREIGRGGMGTVYLAARADDEYRKQVAIKIIKRGMDTAEVLRRFRNERQILASLDHPNIARLLDGGTTEDGMPFFVMEHIEGLALLNYCDAERLSTVERLELYRKICAAVQHAHQNLVVHRDIKPSNIVVISDGTPKLLDFGIAKLLGDDTGQPGKQTATVARIMTPQYASPEQVRGSAITTASDVYSLGVLLYELLTGHHAYHLKALLPREIERVICEKEPERPSTAITRVEESTDADGVTTSNTPASVSEARSERPDGLRRKLKGDLDNIVLKAMRKEPERRYSSVEQFSEDIRRHLEGLPVIATNHTFNYRAGKFVRRNRLGVTAVAIILLSLIAGIVATSWQARAARQEKAKAESINAFLEQILNYSNPVLNLPGDNSRETKMTQVLDEAAKRLEGEEFADQPEVKAELERIIANSYYSQGRYSLGREHMQEYVALERRIYGENHPKALAASATWAALLFNRGEMTEAENLYRQVLPAMRIEQQKGNIKAERLLDELVYFAYLRRTQGDSKEAESLFRESLALSPQLPKESRYILGVTRSTLASTLADQGRFDEALQTAREAVADDRQLGGADRPDFGFSLTVLGGFLTDKGDFAEADASLREAEAIFRLRLSPSHLWLGDNLRNQAISFYRQDKFAEAQNKVSEAGKIYLESFGSHYDHYPTVLIVQGLILNKTGKSEEGETILREAAKLRTESLPKEHFWVAVANSALGECLTTQKRFAEAEPLLVDSYTALNAGLGQRDPRTTEALQRLARLYDAWGKPAQATQYRAMLSKL
jgi:eukaryotic-like serine/threonine-protein kinase